MLIGAIQGIVFALIVFFSKKFKSKSNYFLALLILCFALNNFQYYFWEKGLINGDFFFAYIYFPFATLSMAFFYLYVKFFLYPKKRFKSNLWFFFIPFIIFFGSSVYYKMGNAMDLLSENTRIFFGQLIYVHEIFGVVYSLFLLAISYRLILRFEKKQLKWNRQTLRIGLKWLKTVCLIAFGLCIIWGFSIYDELKYGAENATLYYGLWIGLSFTIYALGHLGIYRFGILEEQKNIHHFSANNSSVIVEIKANQNEHLIAFERFILGDKNYLDNHLSLESVAEALGINKSYLSRIINAELGKSFSDYVNELRVEEAKTYLLNPEFSKYTLISIGLEAGFNSKSAFNSTFKKFTGMTPSEFKQKQIPDTKLSGI